MMLGLGLGLGFKIVLFTARLHVEHVAVHVAVRLGRRGEHVHSFGVDRIEHLAQHPGMVRAVDLDDQVRE